MDLCEIDITCTPPALRIPERFNAAHDLLERNLQAGRSRKTAFIDDAGSYTYGELAARVNRFANGVNSWKCVANSARERVFSCRCSITAQAMESPSNVAVPRPISSRITSERALA